MKKIIYLPIETSGREIDAKLLLAHRALSRGYTVIIGRRCNVLKSAERLGYGIYMNKNHCGEKKFQDLGMVNSGFIFITLDEEGLVFLNDKAYLERSNPHKIDYMSIIFTWGDYQRNLLISENPGLKPKTVSVGNPRFDLLRPEFSTLYMSVNKKILKKWGKYILINTNFVPGNFSRHYKYNYIEGQAMGGSLSEDELRLLLEKKEYYEKLFKQYKEMLLLLAAKFPGINFILRPHPSEDQENWKDALKGFKNLKVIFKGSAVDWMQNALAVIHTGCTTGIEAWALKKPVIAYNPNTKTTFEPELPNKLSLKVSDISELYNILEDVINGRFIGKFDEQSEMIQLYIKSITGKLSSERIMDTLEDLPIDKQIDHKNTEGSMYLELQGIESIKTALLYKILKYIIKYQQIERKFPGKRIIDHFFKQKKFLNELSQFQKFPGLCPSFIRSRLSVYNLIFNRINSNNHLIQRIAEDTYIINKR
jgi:surface carbohydrate biosynthesis protein